MVGVYTNTKPLAGNDIIPPSGGRIVTSKDIKTVNSNKSFSESVGDWWNNITGATAAMKHESEEAQKQRDFEERMSNTALQRQAADAKAAGINAAMLFANSSSSGASTPNGSSGRGHSASGNPFSLLSSTINSAANLARSFNHDRNRGNDVNLRQVLNTVATAARLFT